MKFDTFSLPEGVIEIAWPVLRQENVEDVLDWLALIQRKMVRQAEPMELIEDFEQFNGAD